MALTMAGPASFHDASPPRSSVKVIRQQVEAGQLQPPDEDELAIEDPLELILVAGQGHPRQRGTLTVTMRTPGYDADLIAGFLFCEGIITSAEDISYLEWERPDADKPPVRAVIFLRHGLDWRPDRPQRHFAVHASCGVCGSSSLEQLHLSPNLRIEDPIVIDAGWVHDLPGRMFACQSTFQKTGGLHAAAIFDRTGELLVSREDIGRHNALDKAIGASLGRGHLPVHGATLCVSGRMSYEIIQKALVARIPIIAGVGAPSSLAVSLANDFQITLLGFVRHGRYNIYSCPQRLRPSAASQLSSPPHVSARST